MEKRVTYHEAGHGVVSVILGSPFEYVSVESEKVVRYTYENGKKTPITFLQIKGIVVSEELDKKYTDLLNTGLMDIRHCIGTMAGVAAEGMLIGEMDDEVRAGGRMDTQAIAAICRISLRPNMSIKEACEHPLDGEIENDIGKAFLMEAIRILEDHWDAVEEVARVLNDKKKLTYDEVKKIVDKHKNK